MGQGKSGHEATVRFTSRRAGACVPLTVGPTRVNLAVNQLANSWLAIGFIEMPCDLPLAVDGSGKGKA